ncbi:ABC transporter substrate-binding protein [Phycicoccus sp. MAQZ13P-2]|uniref:ABC transporter substrate-binding protein n=1 Tax=Phycicoccus mangrovi TaxID=2840470 RepID=UPI001C00811B|nr:ABC transporter substrate-binding protein [Phycicoccus mangrovi]MBT9257016.1 ABC transporter substrate-binding protein [Phycicoccus mangrovi]MBT9275494.1 ABC transporter substrate-binding protein [Phycicoccus mangrovi]
MNNVTRRGFLGLAGVAGAAGLSACAGTGTSATSDQGGDGTTLELWSNHPGNSKPVEQELIAAFQKANPGITVKLVDAGKNYEEVAQKFNGALVGGTLPDLVVVSDVTWFNFALNKQLTPLDDLLSTAKIDTADYVDALYGDYLFDGGHFALPYSRSTPLFYYNKEIWSKAGLEDRGPKDWDEFKEWSDALKAAAGNGKFAMELPDGSNYLDWHFQNMAWGYGGGYSQEWTPTFSAEGTVKAGQYLQDLAKAGVVKFNATPEADFSAGLAGCILQSTGSLGGITKDAKFEVGTAFLPGEGNCPTGGAGLGIPANISDARKANAVKLAEFLTNAESTVTFTQATGYMPVRKSAVELPAEKDYLAKNPNAKTAIDQLPQTRSQDNVRVLLPGGGARIGKGLDQVAQGQDVATVFAGLDTESRQVFDNQIKSKL